LNGVPKKNEIRVYSQIPENAYRAETAYNNEKMNNAVSSSFPRWSSTVTTYLVKNDDNTLSVVEDKDTNITVETYDEEYNLIDKKALNMNCPCLVAFIVAKNIITLPLANRNVKKKTRKR